MVFLQQAGLINLSNRFTDKSHFSNMNSVFTQVVSKSGRWHDSVSIMGMGGGLNGGGGVLIVSIKILLIPGGSLFQLLYLQQKSQLTKITSANNVAQLLCHVVPLTTKLTVK